MKQILCFGDSNTFGLVPGEKARYPWGVRWTSILNEKLGVQNYRVIEEGLCGRTSIFDDPLRDGRNSVRFLPTLLESHFPLDLVVIMLGTNDCKSLFGASAQVIAHGVRRLVGQVRQYAPESKILIISPIHLGERVWESGFDLEFSRDSIQVSKDLAQAYRKVAEEENVEFLDASEYAFPSERDQEHMTEEGHKNLADAVYETIQKIGV